MLPQQFVNFRVPRRKLHALHRCARREKNLNRLGRAPVFPVRVHACAYRQGQRRASFPVQYIDWCPAFDEQLHGRVLRAPRRYVQCRAVPRHIEILVTFLVHCPGVHSEFNQMTHTLSMSPFPAQSARCLVAKGLSPVRLSSISSPFDSTLFPAYSAVEGSRVVFSRAPPCQPLGGSAHKRPLCGGAYNPPPRAHPWIVKDRFWFMARGNFGERLKRERELREVSMDELTKATRISTRFVQALENEDWAKLPGGIFGHGFVRTIARYLCLTDDALLPHYDSPPP